LIQRTPYSSGPFARQLQKHLGPAAVFENDGFIFVYQDVRDGSWRRNVHRDDAAQDVRNRRRTWTRARMRYDTIDWLVKTSQGTTAKPGCTEFSYRDFSFSEA